MKLPRLAAALCAAVFLSSCSTVNAWQYDLQRWICSTLELNCSAPEQ